MKVLVPEHVTGTNLSKIKEISSGIEISKLRIDQNNKPIFRLINYFRRGNSLVKISIDGDDIDKADKDVEVFLCSWNINSDILDRIVSSQSGLKWIHFTSSGVDRFITQKLIDSDIVLTSSKGVHSKRVAEFVFAMILCMSKKIPTHLKLQEKKRWESIPSDELKGKTIGILGYGHIGHEIAKKAPAFEMSVLAMRKNNNYRNAVLPVTFTSNIKDLLIESDYLIICAPLTRETRGLISESELSSMKKNAYIINVSRGEIINEEALIRALNENWIAGACLDVCIREPLPPNSPLYSLPNVVITNHSAYLSPNSHREVFNLFLENLRRYIAGEGLLNVVNRELCY